MRVYVDREEKLSPEVETQLMLEFIEKRKVVGLAEIAGEFRMGSNSKAKEWIEQMQSEGKLKGIFDGLGKFIQMTKEEENALIA